MREGGVVMTITQETKVCSTCNQVIQPTITQVRVETKHLQTQVPVVYDRLQAQCPNCGQTLPLTTEQTIENLKRLRQVILS